MRKNKKIYQNKDWLLKMLIDENLCVSKIATECDVSITTISRWAAYFEIREIRPYSGDNKGSKNPYWKGGRYVEGKAGYAWVLKPEHPYANKKGYVAEHRLMAEQIVGRPLRANELVHHKNKIRHDNRIENLEIIILGDPNCGKVTCPFCNKIFKLG
ncbi:MAG: HNH endonuclease [Parcubacteria group bacterium]|nr:HNH endonuclease [Parcubacteria group bacterium]